MDTSQDTQQDSSPARRHPHRHGPDRPRRRPDSNAPTPWSLGGEPPEPQQIAERKPVEIDDFRPGDTHTGTDPIGRAVGPMEDHLAVKKVFNANGKPVAPYKIATDADGKTSSRPLSTTADVKRAKTTAEATGTVAESVDKPTPYTPSEVAQAHADGDVLAPKEA